MLLSFVQKLIGEHPKVPVSTSTTTTKKMGSGPGAAAAGLMRAAVYDASTPEGVKVVSTRPAPAPAAASLLVGTTRYLPPRPRHAF